MPAHKSTKIFIIFIASLAIGVIALPQTIALFAGQHYWYDLSSDVVDVPCEKCHADIVAEMDSHVGPHSSETAIQWVPGSQNMGNFKCYYCHSWYYTGNIFASSNGTDVSPGIGAHAASTVSCISCHRGQQEQFDESAWGDYNWGIAHMGGPGFHSDSCQQGFTCVGGGCHDDPLEKDEFPEHGIEFAGIDSEGFTDGNCKRCHCGYSADYSGYKLVHAPPAGGFGLTYFNSSNQYEGYNWDKGTMEAHIEFTDLSRNGTVLKDENEACLGCHSAIPVKINWMRPSSIEFEIVPEDQANLRYGIHNYSIGKSEYNGSSVILVWGNTSGMGSTDLGRIDWPGDVDSIYD